MRQTWSTSSYLPGLDSGHSLTENGRTLRYYVPGPAIDERVVQIKANGAVTYMHTDRQASVVAVTDAAGNVVSRRGYDSYGETDGTQLVGAGSHPFGDTGRRWDPDLGIYYYRARWYDPTTGTFLQTDPIGSLDYINLYAYVGLEPGNATDPTGLNRALRSVGKVLYEGAKSGDLKKAGVDEFAEIASDLGTLGDPNASGLDKAEAAFNLLSPVSTKDAKAGLDGVKGLVKGMTLRRRPFAKDSIPGHKGKPTAAEQKAINELMQQNGCHTCRTKNPGTKSGNAIVDHQPPQALKDTKEFLPHCIDCMRRQGGETLRELIKRPKK